MSKSFDFAINRAQNLEVSNLTDRDWSGAYEYNAEQFFDQRINGARTCILTGNVDGKEYKFSIKLEFDPDGEFDYFTSSKSVHDGTMIFVSENMESLVRKVLCLNTYYTPKGKPDNGDTVKFTIGNFVILNEYDETGENFTPKDKPYLRERTTVFLPLGYDVIKGNKNEEV